MPARPRLVYILGAGHCGSTLLSLLLNGHRDVFALSEFSKLSASVRDHDEVLTTPTWRRIAARFDQRSAVPLAALDLAHPSWRRFAAWTLAEVQAWAAPRALLLETITEVTGAHTLVDASKAWQQLHLLNRSQLFDVFVIHLVRDGRGIVHAYQRKYGDLRHGLSRWLKPSLVAPWLERQVPADRWLRVHYERLAESPEATLRQICSFLALEFEPAMLRFRSHDWFGIGGNRMRNGQDETIRLDERWRRDMTTRQRLVVDVIGGAVNRYYGYP
jgi:hypothetical protein